MTHEDASKTDRRTFLQAGALTTAASISLASDLAQEAAKASILPTRKAGQNGCRSDDSESRHLECLWS